MFLALRELRAARGRVTLMGGTVALITLLLIMLTGLTGGLANLPGLEVYMEEMTGIRVRTAIDPDICAVTGLKQIIQSRELKKLAYSMLDENYRWMR